MKQLDYNKLKEKQRSDNSKRKMIVVEVAGEEFEILVRQKLGIDQKTKILSVAVALMHEGPELDPLVGITLGLLEAATSLGVDKLDLRQKLDLLNALNEYDITPKIFDAIGEKEIEQLNAFFEDFTSLANLGTEEEMTNFIRKMSEKNEKKQ